MLISLIRNLVILLILAGLVIGITKYYPALKKQTSSQVDKVLGAKSDASSSQSLPSSLKKDAVEQLKTAKETALNINVNDVIQTVTRLQKIPRDFSIASKGLIDTVVEVTSKK